MSESIFEKATRKRFRFQMPEGQVPVGQLTIEQLWELPLVKLNAIAVELDNQAEKSPTKSFLKGKTSTGNQLLKDKPEVVVHVITVLEAEQEAAKTAAEKKAKREKLLDLLNEKENEEFKNMSKEDIIKALAETE